MRDETVYGLVNQVENKVSQIVNFIQQFTQSVRLDSTGKEVRLLALQKLLLKKGLITEAEMTEQAGEVLKEMQQQAEAEAAKVAAPAIVPATPAEVVQVAASTVPEAPIQTGFPPQA